MIFFTSILSNYLPRALILADSVLRIQPKAHFRVYIYDYDSIPQDSLDGLPLRIPQLNLVGLEFHPSTACLPYPDLFEGRYGIVEACTAVKPFIALSMLQRGEECVYLDPDTYIYSSLFPSSSSRLPGDWDLQLTPHVLAPSVSSPLSERLFFAYGIFNLGYFAVKPTEHAIRFIDWWCSIVDPYGVNVPSAGLFVDQKPLDFAPTFVERLDIVRHPGWNVAWWNLFSDGRRLLNAHRVEFDGEVMPLVFFHFSNLDADPVEPFVSRPLRALHFANKQQLFLASDPEMLALYGSYLNLLTDVGALVAGSGVCLSVPRSRRSGLFTRLGLLVNSEIYRLSSLVYSDPSRADGICRSAKAKALPLRLIVLLRLFASSGLPLRRHLAASLMSFVTILFSPTLFEFSHAASRARSLPPSARSANQRL